MWCYNGKMLHEPESLDINTSCSVIGYLSWTRSRFCAVKRVPGLCNFILSQNTEHVTCSVNICTYLLMDNLPSRPARKKTYITTKYDCVSTYVAHTGTRWTDVRALVTNTAYIDIHNNLLDKKDSRLLWMVQYH